MSFRKTSGESSVARPATRSVASDWNATHLPSSLTEEVPLRPSASPPSAATLTRSSVPPMRSRRYTSSTPLPSESTSGSLVEKATHRPSELVEKLPPPSPTSSYSPVRRSNATTSDGPGEPPPASRPLSVTKTTCVPPATRTATVWPPKASADGWSVASSGRPPPSPTTKISLAEPRSPTPSDSDDDSTSAAPPSPSRPTASPPPAATSVTGADNRSTAAPAGDAGGAPLAAMTSTSPSTTPRRISRSPRCPAAGTARQRSACEEGWCRTCR